MYPHSDRIDNHVTLACSVVSKYALFKQADKVDKVALAETLV